MIFDEQAKKFDEEHSGEDGHVVIDGYLLFSDGSMRSLQCWNDLGYEYSDVPVDKTELATRQQRFWNIRLEALVQEFENTKLAAAQASAHGSHKFKELKDQLKQLQTAVRSARSKLTHAEVKIRGYNSRDVERAWSAWRKLQEAIEEESIAKAFYDDALLGKSTPGKLEQLKLQYDKTKKLCQKRMSEWNSFTPRQARHIVTEELDAEARQKREQELAEIEI